VFTSNGTALVWRGDGETLLVEAWGENSLRVRSRMMGDVLEQDFALLPAPAARATIDIEGDRAVIRNGKIRAVLTTESTQEGTATSMSAGVRSSSPTRAGACCSRS